MPVPRGLFGRPNASIAAKYTAEVADPNGVSTVGQRRRGLFGRVRDWATPDRLALIGAAMRDDGSYYQTERARQDELPFNRMRMQAAQEELQNSRSDRAYAMQQRQRRDAYIQGVHDPLAALDPEGYISGQMAANAPLTRAQTADQEYRDRALAQDQSQFQTSNATTRRGQDLSYAAAAARGGRLTAGETGRINDATTAARQARNVQNLVREFQTLNTRVPTGQLSHLRPDQWFNAERERMRQITDTLTPMMREPGTGAMSDGDRQMFANAVPRPGAMGAANLRAGNAMTQAAQNMSDYAVFLDMYSEGGDLRGAEQNWDMYLNANPIYDRYGNVRSDRPSFQAWMAQGQPDMSAEIARSSAAQNASDEEVLAAAGGTSPRARGDVRYNNQVPWLQQRRAGPDQ